jgi:hypothetical protein
LPPLKYFKRSMMDWKINFRDDAILEIKCAGKFSNDSYLRVFEHIVLDPRWRPGKSIIADFRDVVFDGIYFDDVLLSVSMHSQFNDYLGEGKFAAVHSSDNGLRLGKLYAGISSFNINSNISAFKDYEEAIEWIHET